MEIFTVALFGHRRINDIRGVESILAPVISELIATKDFIAFLIGRNGDFDECAARVIKSEIRRASNIESDLTLVLPYKVSNVEFYENYYDNVIIPDAVATAYPKSAIELRNRWMVESSDLVIAYIEESHGGAYKTMKYAEKIGKDVMKLPKTVYSEGI